MHNVMSVMHTIRWDVNRIYVSTIRNLIRQKEVAKELQLYKYRLTYPTFVPPCDFKYLLSQFLIPGNAGYPR